MLATMLDKRWGVAVMSGTTRLEAGVRTFAGSRFRSYTSTGPLLGAHVALALLLLYSLAFASHFTFKFEHIWALDQYRYQAEGFAHLRLDMFDPNTHGPILAGCIDCVNFNGLGYLCYGPFPALIQLLLINVLRLNTSSEAIVWALCAVTLYCSFWIVRWYLRRIISLRHGISTLLACLFAVVIGTGDLYLHTSTIPYAWSQASATAQLCLLLSAFLFVKAFAGSSKRSLWLAASGLLAGFAGLSKQNYMPTFVGGLVMLLWIAYREKWGRRETARQASALVLPALLCVGFLLWFNWARFGNPLDTGMDYINAKPGELAAFQRPQLHRIPYNFYNHFLAGVKIQRSDFPLLMGQSSSFGTMNRRDGSGGLQHNLPMFSIFISMPMLLVLVPGSVWLFVALFRRPPDRELQFGVYLWLLAACSFAYFLAADSSWVRYQYDMLFPIAVLALQLFVYLWRAIANAPHGFSRGALRLGLSAFLVLAFGEQALVGLDQTAGLFLTRNDRFIYWDVTERPSDRLLRRRGQQIRSALFDGQPYAVSTDIAKPLPPVAPAGSVWLVRNQSTFYGSDGSEWFLEAVVARFQLRVTFSKPPHVPMSEPLLQLGHNVPAADMFGVKYSTDGVSLFLDHWGTPACIGKTVGVRWQVPQILTVSTDSSSGHAEASLNGTPILHCNIGVYPNTWKAYTLGKNTDGFTTVGQQFSGSVELISAGAK